MKILDPHILLDIMQGVPDGTVIRRVKMYPDIDSANSDTEEEDDGILVVTSYEVYQASFQKEGREFTLLLVDKGDIETL